MSNVPISDVSEMEETSFLTYKNRDFLYFVRKMNPSQFAFAALKDIENIKNALLLSHLLKNKNMHDLLDRSLQNVIFHALKEKPLYFDHIGLEVFGSLGAYKTLLQQSALIQDTTLTLFQSVQFYEILKQQDQHLRQIDILRVDTINDERIELFSCHQHYLKTLRRNAHVNLTSNRNHDHALPFSHIAIRIGDHEIFNQLVQIMETKCMRDVFGSGAYYNPQDHSHNIKLIIRKPIDCMGIILDICFLEFTIRDHRK